MRRNEIVMSPCLPLLAAACFFLPVFFLGIADPAGAGQQWPPCGDPPDPCCQSPCSGSCSSVAAKCDAGCSGVDQACCDDPCGAACTSTAAKCQAACSGVDPACCDDPCGASCSSTGAKCEAGCSGVDQACCDDPCGASCSSTNAKCEAGCSGVHQACCDDPCGASCEEVGARCEAGCGDMPPACCDTECEDNNACTTDSCDGVGCTHEAIVCEDENSCTQDSCDPELGCVFEPVPGQCSASLGNVFPACPGTQVNLPNLIQNTGECFTNFQWTIDRSTSNLSLSGLPKAGSLGLGPGESDSVTATVTVNPATPRGLETLWLQVSSEGEPTCDDLAVLEVPLKQCSGTTLDPQVFALPGESVQMRFLLSNSGLCRESFVWSVFHAGLPDVTVAPQSATLPALNPGGFAILFPTFTVAPDSPGGSESIIVFGDGGCLMQGTLEVLALDLTVAEVDDEIEEDRGAFVSLNDDDDDGDGNADLGQGEGTTGEDELLPVLLELDVSSLLGGTAELSAPAGAGKIRLYEQPDRTGQQTLPLQLTLQDFPKTLYVEGVDPSAALRDVELRLSYKLPGSTEPDAEDIVKITVFQTEFVDAQAFGPNLSGGLDGDPAGAADATFQKKGAIADGLSVLVPRLGLAGGSFQLDADIELRVEHGRDPLEFPQTAALVGSLHAALPALPALDPGQGALGSTTLALAAATPKIAFWRPPNNFLFGKLPWIEPLRFQIVVDGQVISSRTLELVRPTILLAHGFTSHFSNMEPMRLALKSGGRQARVALFDWFAQNTSGYDVVTPLLQSTIATEILILRGQGWAATRLDYVGHSMGGVVAKWYASNLAPMTLNRGNGFPFLIWAGPTYLRADNFGAGDFRRLVTLGSPLQGSPIADQASSQLGFLNLFTLVQAQPAWNGDAAAFADLAMFGAATATLSAQRPAVSWFPIVGQAAPGATEADQLSTGLVFVLNQLGLGPSDVGLLETNSDIVVLNSSQVDFGLYPRPGINHTLITSVVHSGETANILVHNEIMRLLDLIFDNPNAAGNTPGHTKFNNGF